MHKAAYNGHKDVIKILVDSGAAVDAKSKVNFTSDVYSYQVETGSGHPGHVLSGSSSGFCIGSCALKSGADYST